MPYNTYPENFFEAVEAIELMPILPPEILTCVVYLYKSEDDSRAGEESGGTGFLITTPETTESEAHVYAATNKHIVEKSVLVIRYLNIEGKAAHILTDKSWWRLHPTLDLAVLRIPRQLEATLSATPLKPHDFVTEETLRLGKIGIGSHVVQLSRLNLAQEAERRPPVARYGHIAMGLTMVGKEECFITEVYSRPGSSGSPVFVYANDHDTLHLLGIQCGHLHDDEPVRFQPELKTDDTVPTRDLLVQENIALSYVLPAWTLTDFLFSDQLKQKEDKAELINAPHASTKAINSIGDVRRGRIKFSRD
jgi:hypothetical protein